MFEYYHHFSLVHVTSLDIRILIKELVAIIFDGNTAILRRPTVKVLNNPKMPMKYVENYILQRSFDLDNAQLFIGNVSKWL